MKSPFKSSFGIALLSFMSVMSFSLNAQFASDCMDSAACNFNSEALDDDGSCCYENCGCIDITAVNYTDGAECSDYSCLYLSDCTLLETEMVEYINSCTGVEIELVAENPYVDNYNWVINDEIISEESGVSYTPEISGEQILYMICSNEFCVDTTEILLDIFTLESPNLEHTGLQFCEGESTLLSVVSDYQKVWIYNGQFLSFNESVNIDDGGLYSVVNVEGECTSNTVAVIVIVHPIPVAEIALSSEDFCEGEYVLLQSIHEGNYEWNHNGEFYSSGQFTQTSLEGEFSLLVYNDYCESDVVSVNLTEHSFPDSPIVSFDNGVLNSSLIEGAVYNWFLNGVMVATTEGTTYVPTADGNYYVEAENEFGCGSFSETIFADHVLELKVSDVVLFPNPMKDQAMVRFGTTDIESFQLLDMHGRVIRSYNQLGNTEKLVIYREGLSAGMYYLELIMPDGRREVRKLVMASE